MLTNLFDSYQPMGRWIVCCKRPRKSSASNTQFIRFHIQATNCAYSIKWISNDRFGLRLKFILRVTVNALRESPSLKHLNRKSGFLFCQPFLATFFPYTPKFREQSWPNWKLSTKCFFYGMCVRTGFLGEFETWNFIKSWSAYLNQATWVKWLDHAIFKLFGTKTVATCDFGISF